MTKQTGEPKEQAASVVPYLIRDPGGRVGLLKVSGAGWMVFVIKRRIREELLAEGAPSFHLGVDVGLPLVDDQVLEKEIARVLATPPLAGSHIEDYARAGGRILDIWLAESGSKVLGLKDEQVLMRIGQASSGRSCVIMVRPERLRAAMVIALAKFLGATQEIDNKQCYLITTAPAHDVGDPSVWFAEEDLKKVLQLEQSA